MRQLTVGIDHPFPSDLAFLPSGRDLLGVVGVSLVRWDLETEADRPAWAEDFGGLLFRFAVSPCGRFAAGAEDRCLVLWDLAAGKPRKWLLAGGGQHIADVTFTPDGREVLTVLMEGGGVSRRRTGSWRKLPGFGTSPGRLGDRPASFDGHLAISPDGHLLATSHAQRNNQGLSGIKLWDFPRGAHRRTATCGREWINQLLFSPDGNLLAVQFEYRMVRLYDARTLAVLAEHVPPRPARKKVEDTVCRMAFHPEGRLLAVTGGTRVTFLDVERLRPVRVFDWEIGRTFGIAFNLEGSLAAVGGERGRVVVWDID
jgi:WD40 repeat protein